MHKHIHFGLDVGSGSAKGVALDAAAEVQFSTYRPTQGRPMQVGLEILQDMESRFGADTIGSLTCTGTGGKRIATLLGVDFVNEIICHAKGVERFHPQARTIIDIGGEDAKLILVGPADGNRLAIHDFALNTVCAAGTGAFLEQQAARLGYDMDMFSSLAHQAANVPTIAGRCTVFAKSDMIHLQQNGVQDDEIIAGLCFAIVRNLKTNIAKGKDLHPPLVFQGGVAANLGVRRAITELLVHDPADLIIPEHFKVMGAVGAALEGIRQGKDFTYPGLGPLLDAVHQAPPATDRLTPLHTGMHESQGAGGGRSTGRERPVDAALLPAVLGIDVGSVTTKMVLLDAEACRSGRLDVLAKTYRPTSGRPLQAVAAGLEELRSACPVQVEVTAVGSTGSGRALCSAYVGGDVVRNEISAQAAAATWLAPDVDTIFEIGGQDSKYIRLEGGVIVDFAMNKVCAAGTGSFLEEQSHRLGITVQDFGDLALSSTAPVKMGERCTVFMQSDLVHFQQQGVERADLAAGLCHSIVANYLNKVVEQRPIGHKIFFQGGTAFNQGITAAFGQVLGRTVIVPEHNEVTGAIGAALLATQHQEGRTRFLGFDLSRRKASTKYFECKGCANACEVQQVNFEGESRALYFGHRCDRYDHREGTAREAELDLVHAREQLMREHSRVSVSTRTDQPASGSIGLPRCLFFQEWVPFFSTLFTSLGFEVVCSEPTTRKQIRVGAERMATEACLPMKAAHGHVHDLLSKGVSRIFVPQVRQIPAWEGADEAGTICPYVQSLPWVIRTAFGLDEAGIELVSPVLDLDRSEGGRQWKFLARTLGVPFAAMRRALDQAWSARREFARAVRSMGERALEQVRAGERAVLLIGRPYNALDPGMNMNVARKLSRLGVRTIPLDCLPLDDAGDDLSQMYWAYGKRILAAGRLLADYPQLIPVFVTNFSCGPDAFILHFFERQLGDRPYLELEIDEHTADAGVLTRLEAFLDSTAGLEGQRSARSPFVRTTPGFKADRVLYIPPMTDHLHAFAAAFAANGVEARLLPPSDEESLRLGRKYTKGKECLPAVLTTGDILKAVQEPDFDPSTAAFFMPSAGGPCRFGLYHQLHRLVLEEIGMGQVPVFSPNQGSTLYQELGMVSKDFTKLAWKGVVAVDLLLKLLLEIRPYAHDRRECEDLYAKWLQAVSQAVAKDEDLQEVVRRAAAEFAALPRMQAGSKPVVGIVGEIYVRSNPFANEFLIRRLEDLGLEAWLPTIGEWIHYINHTGKIQARRNRQIKAWLKLELESLVQDRLERNLLQAGNGWLRSLPEPETKALLAAAGPYLSEEFEGEAVLSIGKSLDYLEKDVHGLINVMPFTCMPGGVVDAILPRIRRQRSIPMLSLAYDGQTETNIQNRLEAFAHQVRQQI